MRKSLINVAVIGGGAAGVSAAVAAAQLGAVVILVEPSQRLGGVVTAAMHRCICGLYASAPASAADTLNAGVQRAVVERMVCHAPDSVRPKQFGKAWVLEFPPNAWERTLIELCDEAGVQRRHGTRVTSVRREGDRIISLQLDGNSSESIAPKVVIDCTGGGLLMTMAGDDVAQPIDPNAPSMLAGYAVRFGGLGGELELLRLQIPYTLAVAVQKDKLPTLARFTVFHPGPGAGEGVCKFAVNVADPSVEQIDRVIAYLQTELDGFKSATILERSPHALPRDGRRLHGKYVVTEADVMSARKFGGRSVHAWWPAERWDTATGPSYAYPPAGDHYDIPADAMKSAAIENLLAAGNCLSATAGSAASLRASGICLATGDAAGRLAVEM